MRQNHSPALAEIGENVRAKIYCLMSRIGFNDQLPGVDAEDYVTLALIEKEGQNWRCC